MIMILLVFLICNGEACWLAVLEYSNRNASCPAGRVLRPRTLAGGTPDPLGPKSLLKTRTLLQFLSADDAEAGGKATLPAFSLSLHIQTHALLSPLTTVHWACSARLDRLIKPARASSPSYLSHTPAGGAGNGSVRHEAG